MISLGELFRTKSIEQLKATAETKCLKRTLGALDITTMGIGAIIGIGLFVFLAAPKVDAVNWSNFLPFGVTGVRR